MKVAWGDFVCYLNLPESAPESQVLIQYELHTLVDVRTWVLNREGQYKSFGGLKQRNI